MLSFLNSIKNLISRLPQELIRNSSCTIFPGRSIPIVEKFAPCFFCICLLGGRKAIIFLLSLFPGRALALLTRKKIERRIENEKTNFIIAKSTPCLKKGLKCAGLRWVAEQPTHERPPIFLLRIFRRLYELDK